MKKQSATVAAKKPKWQTPEFRKLAASHAENGINVQFDGQSNGS